MKNFTHREPISMSSPVPLDKVKTYMRVDGNDEDGEIANMALTAASEIEQFAQIALLTQTIRCTVFDPNWESGCRLPIGPVALDHVPTVTVDGQPFTDFDFVGGNRPYIHWRPSFHELRATRVSIEYLAGFGDDASDIPADLAQAVMDVTALHYDGRSPMAGNARTMSPHMARVAARYRGVQV